MAIEHFLAATRHNELHAAAKWALAAIGDDTSRDTRISFPGQEKLLEWTGVSERRLASILEELIARQLIARTRFGRVGRRTEYLWMPTAEELEQLDDRDPNLNRVSQEAIDRVELADLAYALEYAKVAFADAEKRAKRLKTDVARTDLEAARTAVEEAETKISETKTRQASAKAERRAQKGNAEAVENVESWVPPVAPSNPGEGATQSREGATHGTPLRIDLLTTPESSTERHHSAAVENPDSTQHPHPQPKPQQRRELDLIQITTSAATLLAPTGITEPGIAQLANEILDRCPSPVLNPTGYVIHALRHSGHEWQRRAFDIALGLDAPTLDLGVEF